MDVGRFLVMVGALIWSPSKNKYLILKRSAEKDVGGLTWECGTGRVDQGEGFTTALQREIFEELGVEVQIDFIIGTAHFYRGEMKPENEMLGIFYACSLDDPDSLQLSWEHTEFRWVTPDEASVILAEEHWLLRIIKRADDLRDLIQTDLMDYYRRAGFEC